MTARITTLDALDVLRLGRVEYDDGLALQEALAAAVSSGAAPDTLVLLEHDPVITLGRGADRQNVLVTPDELAARGVSVHETGRGGDVTWHGPGQIVGYPIVDLARSRETKDVRKFVRALEEILLRTCADFGVTAERDPENPGIWVGKDKVGAIGVRIAKWITTHGFALNVAPDLAGFDLILPCGIPGRGATSLAELTGRPIAIEDVETKLVKHAAAVLAREPRAREVDQTTIAVAIRRAGEPLALVLHRVPARGGFWQIVTGRMEAGETPRDAAARELVEETGLSGIDLKPLGYEHAFALGSDAPRFGREICFVATVPEGREPRLSEEHDELAWLPLDEAIARVRHHGHRRALRLAAAASFR